MQDVTLVEFLIMSPAVIATLALIVFLPPKK